jgi:hypothetical protein
MNEEQIRDAIRTLAFEMISSRDLGRLCADYMDIDQNDLYDVYMYLNKLLDETE